MLIAAEIHFSISLRRHYRRQLGIHQPSSIMGLMALIQSLSETEISRCWRAISTAVAGAGGLLDTIREPISPMVLFLFEN